MLSGGQQQRVALARAAVVEPRVLLLDEPLSNLDAKLREQMRIELRELVKSLKMTAVHITHDQSEAMAIADKVIYMREGRIEQEGQPRELYNHPVNRHVAEFVGTATFLDGEIVGSAGTNAKTIRIANSLELIAAMVPDHWRRVVVALRPEAVQLTPAASERKNSFSAVVRSEVFLGESTEYMLDVGRISMKCKAREEFPVGAAVFATIDPRDVICLPEMEDQASYQVSAGRQ
jgi:iron(III) transport system ATP-binding protein